jgi:hypothetical protein
MPALLTRMSKRPKTFNTCRHICSPDLAGSYISLHREGTAARRPNFGHCLLCQQRFTEPHCIPRRCQCDAAAYTSSGASNKSRHMFESSTAFHSHIARTRQASARSGLYRPPNIILQVPAKVHFMPGSEAHEGIKQIL